MFFEFARYFLKYSGLYMYDINRKAIYIYKAIYTIYIYI